MATLPHEGFYVELDEYYVTLDFIRYVDESGKTFRYTPMVKYFHNQTERMLCLFELMPVLNPRKAARKFYREHMKTCRISRPSSFIYYEDSSNHEHDEEFYVEL